MYRYVSLVAVLIAFHYAMTGFFAAGKARQQTFTKEFMEANVKEEHERHFSDFKLKTVPKGGYPDVGSGRYSEKLTYK